MRAGLYARVSREEQAEGYSLDAQLEAMRRFCGDRGWTVVREYTEEGYTGTKTDRPAFTEALADCAGGKLDILLTHQLDRFYRNLKQQLDTLAKLGTWQVGYLSVTEQIDYSTPQGMLFLQMLGAFNEYYVANLKRETKKGKRGRAKAGKNNASSPAYGYSRNDQGIDVPDPATSPAVVLAFEAYAGGDVSDTDVADFLNRRGFPPTGKAESRKWTREGVRYLLTNPFYAGWVRYGADLHPGQHEALIDQDLFDKVQALRARRNAGRGGPRRADRAYLLAGLAVCADCGTPLVCQTQINPGQAEIQQYRCSADRRGFACSSRRRMAAARVVDDQVGELVGRLRLPEDWRARLEELSSHEQTKGDLEGKRRYLEGKARRLRDLYLEGDYTRAEYGRLRADLQAQLEAVRDPEAPQVQAAGVTLEALAEAWRVAPVAMRSQILKTIFAEVRVDVTARRLVAVKPWPAFLPLFRMDGLEEREDGWFYPTENEA